MPGVSRIRHRPLLRWLVRAGGFPDAAGDKLGNWGRPDVGEEFAKSRRYRTVTTDIGRRRICKTERDIAGRRICKVLEVSLRGVERSAGCWIKLRNVRWFCPRVADDCLPATALADNRLASRHSFRSGRRGAATAARGRAARACVASQSLMRRP
jgi:hypothetical protein